MSGVALAAAGFLALYAHEVPRVYAENPERVAVVAVASEQAQAVLLPTWPRYNKKGSVTPRSLSAAIAAVVIEESGLDVAVHGGSKRGLAGEVCLMQIHPSNPQWQRHGAPSFDALGGTDLQATTWCILAGGQSLLSSLNYCWRKRFWSNWAQAMFTSYHLGHSCWLSPGAYRRTGYMRRLAAQSWDATPEQTELVERVRDAG